MNFVKTPCLNKIKNYKKCGEKNSKNLSSSNIPQETLRAILHNKGEF